MILYAVEQGELTLVDRSWAENMFDFFNYISQMYDDLMKNGKEAPRILDPQIRTRCITRGWKRTDFETFMRRVQESSRASSRALEAGTDDDKLKHWKTVFLDLWPAEELVKAEARKEALRVQPGAAHVSSSGNVLSSVGVLSRATKYYGRR